MAFTVHIGSHKTGTTAIQHFAAAHRSELRRRGLWYPSYAEIGLREHYGHHHVAHAIAGDARPNFSLADACRFIERIRAKRRPGETVLLSAEPLYRHLLGEDGGYWDRRRAFVRRFAEILGTGDVTILAVLRRQDGLARSLYQEQVKATKYTKDFRAFLADKEGFFQYHRQIGLFRDAFGAVDVLVYEDLARDGLIDAFFRRFGLDVSDLRRPEAVNRSLPIELVEYKRLLNATALGREELTRIAQKLTRYAERRSPDGEPPVDWMSAAEMKAFVESFDEGNEMVRREFAGAHPAPLFPPVADLAGNAAVKYPGITVERFAELTGAIFLRKPPSRPSISKRIGAVLRSRSRSQGKQTM